MNKGDQPWGKRPLGTVRFSIQHRDAEAKQQSWVKLFLTYLALGFGIGCISWAMFNLWIQQEYSADAASGSQSRYSAERVKAKTDSPLVMPTTEKGLYPVYPVEGDNIGSLTMPALNLKIPIIQGTSAKSLKKGVGHFIQSVLPGEIDNCVLSGHRETVFRHMGELKIGDQLMVQTSAGTFTYEVNGMRIVDADDRTVIVPTGDAVLTMTTCYPFNTPGYYPERYIVSANLVKSELTIKSK